MKNETPAPFGAGEFFVLRNILGGSWILRVNGHSEIGKR